MLKIKSLYVSFVKEYFTLNNINLELSPSEKLVIIGSKDSGRSALLRTIVGLEAIAKGEILIKNMPLSRIDFESDVELGYVPANPAFLEKKTVVENIEYIVKLRNENKNFINAKVQNALNEYGLSFIRNKKVKELNYFDRLKLALARLSTRNIELLLIDDIFVTLSTMEKEKAIKLIKNLVKSQGCATLIMVNTQEVASMIGYKTKYLDYGSLSDDLPTEE